MTTTGPSLLRDAARLIRLAWAAAAGHRRVVVWLLVATPAGALLALVYPLVGRYLIDALIAGASQPWLWPIGLACATAVVQTLLATTGALLRLQAQLDMTLRLQSQLVEHMLRAPWSASIVGGASGDSGGHVINDAGVASRALLGLLPDTLAAGVQLAAVLAVLAWWDPVVALALLGALPLFALLTLPGRRRLRERQRDLATLGSDQIRRLIHTLGARLVYKLTGAEARATGEYRDAGAELTVQQYALARRVAWLSLRDRLLARGLALSVIILLVSRTAAGGADGPLGTGQLVAGIAMLGIVAGPLAQLASLATTVQQLLGAYDRLHAVLQLESEPTAAPDVPEVLPAGPLALHATGLSFSWTAGAPTLHNVSLDIVPGKITGLAGPTGCGKTTLALLLARILQPASGTLTLGSHAAAEVPLAEWRRAVTVVPQRDPLPGDTLRAALTLAAPGTTDDTLRALLDDLGASAWLASLPAGLDTPPGAHGDAVSGGQRQLVGIARALLARPRVLILDEATAGLDEASEARVLRAVRDRMRDGAVLLISHRESALASADVVTHLSPSQTPPGEPGM
ncbi:MAG: ABC transporter ATP-binding protein [Planctomycetota bacterium]